MTLKDANQKQERALRRWRDAELGFAREAGKFTNADTPRRVDLEAAVRLSRLRTRADRQMNNYFQTYMD